MRAVWSVLIPVFLSAVLLACQARPSAAEITQTPVTQTETSDLLTEENSSPTSELTVVGEVPPTGLTLDPLQSKPTPELSEMPSNPVPVEKFVSLSKKDLAGRLHIDESEIALLKTAEMVWPNAALGCPAPGKVYAQVRVPGFQIWLEAGKTKYIYNTDQTGRTVLCFLENPDGSVTPFSTAGPEINVPIK
jgi:hypothetical protein